jgi:hypothetical protein
MNATGSPAAGAGAGRKWIAALRTHLRDPTVLAIVAAAFFISAVGQALVQAYVDGSSAVTAAVLSVLGSASLATAIVIAARRHG